MRKPISGEWEEYKDKVINKIAFNFMNNIFKNYFYNYIDEKECQERFIEELGYYFNPQKGDYRVKKFNKEEKKIIFEEITKFMNYLKEKYEIDFSISDHISLFDNPKERQISLLKELNTYDAKIENDYNLKTIAKKFMRDYDTLRDDYNALCEGIKFLGVEFKISDNELANSRHPILLNLSFEELLAVYKLLENHKNESVLLDTFINKMSTQLSMYARSKLRENGITLNYEYENKSSYEIVNESNSIIDKILWYSKRRFKVKIHTKDKEYIGVKILEMEEDKIVLDNKEKVFIKDIVIIQL